MKLSGKPGHEQARAGGQGRLVSCMAEPQLCVCLSVRLHALCPNPPRPPPAACSCLCVQRENKLLRAGFEGRKQGFIETPKRAAAPAAAAK